MRCSVFVVGTRAQLVKLAPVLTLAVESALDHVVWFTGQHDESIADLIDDFGIRSEFVYPDDRKERSSIFKLLTWFPGTLLACIRYTRGIRKRTGAAPLVIVHGDTLSTWLGAMAGRLSGGLVVHVESGLSSGKLTDPFPEEILRRLTFRLTQVAMCPNDAACERMRRYRGCEIVHTGENTLLDCVRLALRNYAGASAVDAPSCYVASIHRFQNIYNRSRLEDIVAQLIALADEAPVEFILHPPTELRLRKYGLIGRLESTSAIRLRPRLPYSEFLELVAGARGVISDGGSNQEELAYLGIPTVLFRERSERPDGLQENVVLRDPSSAMLAEFARSGQFEELRRRRRIDDEVYPSQTVVSALLELARQEGEHAPAQ